VPQTALSALASLDAELTPIRIVAERLAGTDSIIDSSSGAALFSHRPKIGTEAYACTIFPAISAGLMARYEELHCSEFHIPIAYRKVLLRMNGASIFRLSLYGLPISMCQEPPLLDRSARQPLDLGSANLHWRRRYSSDRGQFQFGASPYSREENVAYFLNGNGSVSAVLNGGRKIWEWSSIQRFLEVELLRSESAFAEFENRMGAIPVLPTPEGTTCKRRGRQ